MAKQKYKYILSAGAKGQLYPPKPLYERKDGGKFDLDNRDSLTQQDLEYLCENNYTNLVVRVEVPEADNSDKKENKKAKAK